MPAAKMRKALDRFCAEEIDVDTLATNYPSCACEDAISPDGSPGSIELGEILRLFLTSPTHLRVKKPTDLNKRAFRAADLKRAYSVGLSVCRLKHASQEELEYTARKLYEIQSAANGEIGGVIGAVDFPVDAVRKCPKDVVPLCAHETPLDPKSEGGYRRPSHGDVVNSRCGMSPEEQKASRDLIFNQIVTQGTVRDSNSISDFSISPFLPTTAQ